MRRLLLLSGIASSVVYIVADVLGALRYPGYSYVDQTISELSAIGAPSRPLMLGLFGIYPALLLLFAIGVWLTSDRGPLQLIAALFALYALACIPFAPMHTREVLAAGGDTWTDTMHLVMTAIDSLLLMSMIVIGAWTFGRRYRVYSIATLVVMLVGGAYTSLYASAVEANQPTPWIGITERVTVFAAMLWIVSFAIIMLAQPTYSRNIPSVRSRASLAAAPS